MTCSYIAGQEIQKLPHAATAPQDNALAHNVSKTSHTVCHFMVIPSQHCVNKTLLLSVIIITASFSIGLAFHRLAIPIPTQSLPRIVYTRFYRNTLLTVQMSTKKGKSTTSSKTTANTSSTIHHIVAGDAPTWMNRERTRIVTFPQGVTKPNIPTSEDSKLKSCVYYWMQRDVRAVDNWALHYAEFLAQKYQVPLRVVYTLPPPPPSSKPSAVGDPSNTTVLPPKVYDMNLTHRHGMFLIEGLKYVSKELSKVHTPLDILFPSSRDEVGSCLYQHVCPDSLPSQKSSKTSPPQSNTNMNAIAVVCDMSPLRHFRTWTEDQAAPLLANASIPLIQVDAHNIVPVWYASDKREVGARTLRPRIHRHLEPFLTHYPTFHGNQHMSSSSSSTIPILKSDQENGSLWNRCIQYLSLDESVKLPSHYQAGADAAMKQFHLFCEQGLKVFDTERNDPNFSNVCSSLSPWINYGHVSFQRLALEVRALKKYPNGTASYLEEGIVRRELSDNFCYYAKDHYDELSAAAGWAIETLRVHESDPREYVYSLGEFERGATHDELWNAAQLQVVREGKMHGFMRMYWAKKILEWTPSPDIALRTAQYLNDRFALDGNDPNGFTGVGWSIMGIHDMGWTERTIFGKIRFMNYDGCKRKFKIATYVAKYPGALENSVQATKGKKSSGIKRKTAS